MDKFKLIKYNSMLYKYNHSFREDHHTDHIIHVFKSVLEEIGDISSLGFTLPELESRTEVPTPLEEALYG